MKLLSRLLIIVILIIFAVISIKAIPIIYKIYSPIKKLENAFNDTQSIQVTIYGSRLDDSCYIITNNLIINNIKNDIVNYNDEKLYTIITGVQYGMSRSFLLKLYDDNQEIKSIRIYGDVVVINDCVRVETGRNIDVKLLGYLDIE